MVEVGDEIELSTKKVGQAPRKGTVIAVRERLVTVRWPTGEQSTLVPSPGTLSVVRPARRKNKNAKTTPPTKSAESKTVSRKKTTATKAAKVKRASEGTSKKKPSGTKRSR